MGHSVFSAEPKSFKIHRRSSLASELKSSISRQLLLFLSDYSDDVLSEYITVLVSNGKNQYQARDDLEAFLGDRTGDFVSWLWDILLKYVHESGEETDLSKPKDSDGYKNYMAKRFRKFQNHGSSNASDPMHPEDEETYHPSCAACHNFLSNDTANCLTSAAPLPQMDTKACRNTVRTVAATENVFTYDSSEKGGLSVIFSGGAQTIPHVDGFNKTIYSSCNGSPDQLSNFPKRRLLSRDCRSSITECSRSQQICAINVSRGLSPRSLGCLSYPNDKSRGSVWDRLGKPSDHMSMRRNTVEAHGAGIMNQDHEVLNERPSMRLVPNSDFSGCMTSKVLKLTDRCAQSNLPRTMKLGSTMTINSKNSIVSNIRQKRHFSEISAEPGVDPVSSSFGPERNGDLQFQGISQKSKKSNSTSKDSKTSSNFISKVLDVKQRLYQIETEMFKLRSKQEKEKVGKAHLRSYCGVLQKPEDDVESRSVLVTNVHFAATQEALSLYFAKCGMVENVVILTDKATDQPKGTAHVTFASKDCVDRALAVSGSTFFSRVLKVSRYTKEAATSALAQHTGKLSQGALSQPSKKVVPSTPYSSSHLQWRREAVPSSL